MNQLTAQRKPLNEDEVFTVHIPWIIPENIPFQINELEMEIIALQQHIIDSQAEQIKARQAPQDEKLKEKYNAILAEREELLSAKGRAIAETDVIRNDRARYIERNQELESELQASKAECEKLSLELKEVKRQLRHANAELEGVPTLIENRVRSAIAEHTGDAELKRQYEILEVKYKERGEVNARLVKEAAELRAKDKEINEVVAMLVESGARSAEIATEVDQQWKEIVTEIEDAIAYCHLMAQENDTLRNNNLYLTLLKEYDELRTIYDDEKTGWKGLVFSQTMVRKAPDPDPNGELPEHLPHSKYAVCFALNEYTGVGHCVFVNAAGELTFPEGVAKKYLLPEKQRQAFLESMSKAEIQNFNKAVEESTERHFDIVKLAPYIMEDWGMHQSVSTLSERLVKKVPREQLIRVDNTIKRINALIPKSNKLIQRVNTKFNADFPLVEVSKKTANLARNKSKRKRK